MRLKTVGVGGLTTMRIHNRKPMRIVVFSDLVLISSLGDLIMMSFSHDSVNSGEGSG